MTLDAATRRPGLVTVCAAVLLGLFAALGLLAYHRQSGTTFDHVVLDAMVHHRGPGLSTWAFTITTIFSPVGTAVLAVTAAAVLWRRLGSPVPGILVLAALAAAFGASTATKVVVDAHRPPAVLQLITETDPSFPSGHVTATVALLGALTAVIGHHAGRTIRALMVAATVVAGIAVGFTRLYLGVHWASDVLGGLMLGTAAALLTQVAYRHWQQPSGANRHVGPSSTADPVPTSVRSGNRTRSNTLPIRMTASRRLPRGSDQ